MGRFLIGGAVRLNNSQPIAVVILNGYAVRPKEIGVTLVGLSG